MISYSTIIRFLRTSYPECGVNPNLQAQDIRAVWPDDSGATISIRAGPEGEFLWCEWSSLVTGGGLDFLTQVIGISLSSALWI